MEANKSEVNANVTKAFNDYPEVSTVYVCKKGNVYFSPSARKDLKAVSRQELEVNKKKTNQNQNK